MYTCIKIKDEMHCDDYFVLLEFSSEIRAGRMYLPQVMRDISKKSLVVVTLPWIKGGVWGMG